MKKFLSIFLSSVILLTSLSFNITAAIADDITFDDGIAASFDTATSTLYLTGGEGAQIGNSYDWSLVSGLNSVSDVKVIKVSAYIDFIGAGVFRDFVNTQSMYVENSYCGFADRNSVPPNAELFGFENSYAMNFAQENGIVFHKLYRVTFICTKSDRGDFTAIFPEGTTKTQLSNYNNLFVGIDGTNKHMQYYFVASTAVGSEGLNKDVTLNESSRQRDCSFVSNPEQTSCTLCGKPNPAFVTSPEEPSTEPTTQPSSQPTTSPATKPTQPTTQPATAPTTQPTTQQVVNQPSTKPTAKPTTQPATAPTAPATTTTTKPSATKQAKPAGATKVGSEWVASKQKNTKIKKLTKAKKSFKAIWSKVTGVTGYQIQYSTDKKFKKSKKTVTISKNKTTSKTVKGLKSKKKYYVRIRTYKNVKLNGKTVKVYSKWSSAKTVTTK